MRRDLDVFGVEACHAFIYRAAVARELCMIKNAESTYLSELVQCMERTERPIRAH
jgi:hypothetical protein